MNSSTHIALAQARSTGSSLMEVLIAILVTSIALLGLAKLQALGNKFSQTAYLRGIATMQAYDMSDRMRANLSAVFSGGYDAVTTSPGTDPACFPATGCSPNNMALHNIFAWNTANAALLPGGGGTVTHAANTAYVITVSWTEKCTAATTGNAGESGCSTNGTVTRSFATTFSL